MKDLTNNPELLYDCDNKEIVLVRDEEWMVEFFYDGEVMKCFLTPREIKEKGAWWDEGVVDKQDYPFRHIRKKGCPLAVYPVEDMVEILKENDFVVY